MSAVLLVQGEARQIPLRDGSVHVCVTSPPYFGLRSYGIGADQGELGSEPLHDCLAWARQEPPCAACCWVCAMRAVFREVKRVLRDDGVMFVNVGDAYTSGNRVGHGTRVGYKQQTNRGMNGTSDPPRAPQPPGLREKNLLGLPWRLALALQADGFILRSELIWHKLNPMPESVQDRPTRAHEQVFLFSKQGRYYYNGEAVREPALVGDHPRNTNKEYGPPEAQRASMKRQHDATALGVEQGRACRSVWSLASEPFSGSHFATFPTELVRKCLLAGAPTQVCRQCSAPWTRQVERTSEVASSHNGSRFDVGKSAHHGHVQAGMRYVSVVGDWQPTCHCGAPGDGKAVVLDPFCGSGTTLLVARELGHHGVGLDLSYPYLHDIARERLGLTALAAWAGHAPARPGLTYDDLPLFQGRGGRLMHPAARMPSRPAGDALAAAPRGRPG